MARRDEFEAANQRAKNRRERFPIASSARYDRRLNRIVVELSSGVELSFSPQRAQGLEGARPADLSEIEITPSGFGLHCPKLDADLYLPALMEGILGSRRWMAARMGAAGGKAKSPAKASASRRNGRLGGRPKKAVVS